MTLGAGFGVLFEWISLEARLEIARRIALPASNQEKEVERYRLIFIAAARARRWPCLVRRRRRGRGHGAVGAHRLRRGARLLALLAAWLQGRRASRRSSSTTTATPSRSTGTRSCASPGARCRRCAPIAREKALYVDVRRPGAQPPASPPRARLLASASTAPTSCCQRVLDARAADAHKVEASPGA